MIRQAVSTPSEQAELLQVFNATTKISGLFCVSGAPESTPDRIEKMLLDWDVWVHLNASAQIDAFLAWTDRNMVIPQTSFMCYSPALASESVQVICGELVLKIFEEAHAVGHMVIEAVDLLDGCLKGFMFLQGMRGVILHTATDLILVKPNSHTFSYDVQKSLFVLQEMSKLGFDNLTWASMDAIPNKKVPL